MSTGSRRNAPKLQVLWNTHRGKKPRWISLRDPTYLTSYGRALVSSLDTPQTLSCTQHGYEEAIWTQDGIHFLRAIEHAFIDFGGVPHAATRQFESSDGRACLYDPDVSEFYAAFARHWGFVPLPARPHHPQKYGIVENSNGYVKDNAIKGRRFDSLEELNAHLALWNRTIAWLRIHGTKRKQVYSHFLEMEKPALRPLASECFSLFEIGTRTIHPDGHAQIGGSYYSVPHKLVGKDVRV